MARFLRLHLVVFGLASLAALTAGQETPSPTPVVAIETLETLGLGDNIPPPMLQGDSVVPTKEEEEEAGQPDDLGTGDVLGETNLGGVIDPIEFADAPALIQSIVDPDALTLPGPMSGDNMADMTAEEEDAVETIDEVNAINNPTDAEATATDIKEAEATEATAPSDEVADITQEVPIHEVVKAIEQATVVEPPVLFISSFECDVTEILVSESDNYLTCTVSANSNKGVSTISAAFYNVPMTKRILLNFGEAELVDGDNFNGLWQLDLTIPKAADQGV